MQQHDHSEKVVDPLRIGGIQPCTLIDYPGKLACVIFTQGCVLRCKYCHNPELVEPKLFTNCIPEERVWAFLQKRVGQLEGVVISGGEPTLQRGLIPFIEEVKDLGYLVKLDTCGYFPEVVSYLLDHHLIDYIAMDMKAPLDTYQKVTQVNTNVQRIKKSIALILSATIPYEFRTTVIKELLSKNDLLQIAQEIRGAQQYYIQKFRPNTILLPELNQSHNYSDTEFEDILHMIQPFVVHCAVR